MKSKSKTIIVCFFLLAGISLAACAPLLTAAPTPTPIILKQTVEVPVQQTVQVTVRETVAVPIVMTATPVPTVAPKNGGTLIVARTEDLKGLDPHKQSAPSTLRVLELIYDSLFTFDQDMKIVPWLAESWKWSDDGKTLTVSLRKNVRFHSGDPLTSSDVKFSFERILDDKTGAVARASFTDISKIDAPDSATVVFTLKRANATILAAMAQPNAAIVSKNFASGGDLSSVAIGTGAFKLVQWNPNKSFILIANKDYWMPGLPRLDGIEFRIVPDEATALAGLRAKTLDWAAIADPRIAIRAGASTLTIARAPSLGFHALTLNSNRAIFSDVRVRQAIACAVDRQEVVDVVALGEGQVTGPLTLPFYRASFDNLFCYQKDTDKVKQLLTDAGKTTLPKFKILASTDDVQGTVAEAQNIQAQLHRVGIESDIDSVDQSTFVDRWAKGDFDAAVAALGGYPDPDAMLSRYWQSTGSLNKIAGYRDVDLDKMLDQARATTDPNQRKSIYDAAQKKIVEASPWVWLYANYEYAVMQSYVKGYTPYPNSIRSLSQVWLDK